MNIDLRFMNDPARSKIRSFTDLIVWETGHKLVILIYQITKNFPREETYSLTNQMRRAASSITSNIAEGFGRRTYKEKIQFYYQAQGSLTELKNQILIAKDIDYLTETQIFQLVELSNSTHQLLQGLIKRSKTFLNHKS